MIFPQTVPQPRAVRCRCGRPRHIMAVRRRPFLMKHSRRPRAARSLGDISVRFNHGRLLRADSALLFHEILFDDSRTLSKRVHGFE
ncbi:hypothetical protein EVAR_44103_1 [Eumeta japonica]|uniref:Uncharacterized protein n=1 Tax=Eumeta variegata TaxID=151549 RepID=A0A4C1X513_EUMVA|nr:hypothetical protein EVAR_44103_1 [Eumeta japonica]